IDRFMSEARAVTNFSGNAVATLLVGSWTGTVDKARVEEVLAGRDPFNEQDMVDEEPLDRPRTHDDTIVTEKELAAR
ncbi:MAG TPA: C4-dicarboxylate transporter DctA, partial [Gordonia polyisoprenivorans]|nr:C4-dicarboxylate transporter DctA [Gordonia polyisoprenivorans]